MCQPGEAKRRGKKVELRDDWEGVKLSIMLELVRKKFSTEPLRSMLLNTKDVPIEEGNWWDDYFWGTVNGVGENHLGKILMQVREELKEKEAIVA